MITRRHAIGLTAAAALAPSLAGPMSAQTSSERALSVPNWPNRFVRLIVPFPPGGGADAIARIVSARLSETWGQQVVIENRGGASGNIAAEAAARSAPDGYTIFLAGDFQAVNLYLYPKLSYDPVADFAPVTLVVQYPSAMVVPNSSPSHSVTEFIAYAKANRGTVRFASPGHGTSPHLAGELFKRAAGIEMTTVPYRGAAPAIQDVIPGRVDVFFNNIAPLLSLMQQGQLRALAVTTAMRKPIATTTLGPASFLLFTAMVHADEIRVLSTQATEEAYRELVPQFEKASGHKVTTVFTGTLDANSAWQP